MSGLFRLLVLLALSLSSVSFAQKKNSAILEDNARRQGLQASAKMWFESQLLPWASQVLSPMEGYGVSVKEPTVILPPNLGGPLKMIQVTVEVRMSGWNYSSYHYHSRFSTFPERGWAQCRYSQKLWAQVNGKGYPVKLMPNQKANAMIGCANIGFWEPEYHGIRERRW